MFLTLASFFGILILLVLAHELGHFVTAKLAGVQVLEFGLGYPPRLFGMRWRGTIYSLNALPLGGFVRLLGEEDPSAPGSLASKRIPVRMLVLSAGAMMNAILPLLLFSISFMVPRQIDVGRVIVIQEIEATSPGVEIDTQPGDMLLDMSSSTAALIQPDDEFLSINGNEIRNVGDLRYQLQLNLGKQADIALKRADSVVTVSLVPRLKPSPDQGATRIIAVIRTVDVSTASVSYPVWRAVPMAGSTLAHTFILFRNEVRSWFTGGGPPQVAGPVGIAELTGQVARAGLSPLLEFTAFLSINLAIVNLFPIPGLDGGRLAFVTLEAVRRGRRISPKVEGLIHLIGFAALIATILLITYFDILRMINGGS